MPRKIIKRYLPDPEKIRQQKSLGILAKYLGNPEIWTLTRHSVAAGFSIGLFMAFLPIPLQMLPATLLAVFLRANLPITFLCVWITNPLTSPPIYYACYLFGSWLLNIPALPRPEDASMTDWFMTQIQQIFVPLYLGSILTGSMLALIANVAVRLFWRWQVSANWKQRKRARLPSTAARKKPSSSSRDD